jgi:hypothetical protein
MTRVIHIKDAPLGWREDQNYVFIGRPSPYENEHRVVEPTKEDPGCPRGEAKRRFDEDFQKNKKLQELVIKNLLFKTLVCYCKPKACHGDTYVEFLDKYINKPGFETEYKKEKKNGFFNE